MPCLRIASTLAGHWSMKVTSRPARARSAPMPAPLAPVPSIAILRSLTFELMVHLSLPDTFLRVPEKIISLVRTHPKIAAAAAALPHPPLLTEMTVPTVASSVAGQRRTPGPAESQVHAANPVSKNHFRAQQPLARERAAVNLLPLKKVRARQAIDLNLQFEQTRPELAHRIFEIAISD